MLAFNQRFKQAISERRDRDLLRNVVPIKGRNDRLFSHSQHCYLNFSSNDYLGLATDKSLMKEWQKGIDLYGNGSGASPLVTGFSQAHQELEQSLCEWLGFDRALFFSSGFAANQAVLFTLLAKNDLLVQDKLNHASLIEAGLLSPAQMKRFKHNDLLHLKTLLDRECMVVTEGVFSMDGDLSPLTEIKSLMAHQGLLVVDDAHGIGVLGEEGRGSCNYAGVQPDILIVTFGKALGISGAAILCNQLIGEYLTQFARHYVYSTALPPAQAFAICRSIDMVREQSWRREKLAELSHLYQVKLSDFCESINTFTPIKPLIAGETGRALRIAEQMKKQGFWLTAIRPPTVAKGSARLRVTLTATHTKDQITALTKTLKSVLKDSK